MKKQITVLSAHSDDVAYSIPIYLNKLAEENIPINLIFVYSITNYSPNELINDVEAITEIRKQETKLFAQCLRANIKWLYLEDACLRPDYTKIDPCDATKMTARDTELVQIVARNIQNNGTILFPLAIGGHIDHRILMEVGAKYARRNNNIMFYEDLPYAYEYKENEILEQVSSFSRKISKPLEKILVSNPNYESIKKEAARNNCSQLLEQYIDEIISYTKRRFSVDGGHERIWKIKN